MQLIDKGQCIFAYREVGKEETAVVAAEDPILKTLREKKVQYLSTKSSKVSDNELNDSDPKSTSFLSKMTAIMEKLITLGLSDFC
jgi:UPF0288 family protein (methanogenesis marker protein 3)